MKHLTVSANRSIQLSNVVANERQAVTLTYAVRAYGFLLRSRPPASYTLAEFADLISANYDEKVSLTSVILRVLAEVQAQTEAQLAVTSG